MTDDINEYQLASVIGDLMSEKELELNFSTNPPNRQGKNGSYSFRFPYSDLMTDCVNR